MGYTTDFHGKFTVTPALDAAQVAYLQAFNETRRMKRDAAITETREDPKRHAVGLPVGLEGGYFVGESGMAGQCEEPAGMDWKDRGKWLKETLGVLDYNSPPAGQPGLWCQWTPSDQGTEIEWDGGEKFYHYVEWIKYIIRNFLGPWGRVLDGEVEWFGEDRDDRGKIVVKGNVVKTMAMVATYREE